MENMMYNKNAQKGFTIIELIVVVVIFGIMAAFALHQYSALVKQSRIAVLNGVQASVIALAAMTNALAGGSTTYQMANGKPLCMINGYPDSANGATCYSICSFINFSGMKCTPSQVSGGIATFDFAKTVSGCKIEYQPTTTGPRIIANTMNGC